MGVSLAEPANHTFFGYTRPTAWPLEQAAARKPPREALSVFRRHQVARQGRLNPLYFASMIRSIFGVRHPRFRYGPWLEQRSAVRAPKEYSKAVIAFGQGKRADAAYCLGAMAHYAWGVAPRISWTAG